MPWSVFEFSLTQVRNGLCQVETFHAGTVFAVLVDLERLCTLSWEDISDHLALSEVE